MLELGYAEGRNLALEMRFSEGNAERFPALAADLMPLNVDLVLALGTPAAQATKRVSATIPIVMIGGRNVVESGLVSSLARPGGNVTGLVQDVGQGSLMKSLELLKEAAPRIVRIGVLTSSQAENLDALRMLQAGAGALGVTLQAYLVSDLADIENAFTTMSQARMDAMLALPSHPLIEHRRIVVELAARHRVPAMYWYDGFVRLGGLMSHGVDFRDLYRRAGDYADKIFKGAKPADLPIEQPTKFELLVNVRAARALGLTVPPSLLLRANHVIE